MLSFSRPSGTWRLRRKKIAFSIVMIFPRARVVGICEPSAVSPQGPNLGHLKEQDMLLTAVISLVAALLIFNFLYSKLTALIFKSPYC